MAKIKVPKTDIVDENELNIEPIQPELPKENISVSEKSSEIKNDFTKVQLSTKSSIFQNLWMLFRNHKKLSISLLVFVLILFLMAIPKSRYGLLGMVMKKNVILYTVDDKSSSLIYNTIVSIDGKKTGCDSRGSPYPNCIANIPVGTHIVKVSAANYKDIEAKITVGVGKSKDKNIEIPMTATGRTISMHISNKINGSGIDNAHVKILNSETDTNERGDGAVVVDPIAKAVDVEISREGYNTLKTSIEILDTDNNFKQFEMTPAGKIYFLSKLSGKIDVVKTDIDGANRQVVVAGTGREEDSNTVLLASRDWKYLALLTRRDGSKPKLFLLETFNDQLTEIDSGDSTFSLVGWKDHYFVYSVNRDSVLDWQSNKFALKTFNADNLQLSIVDETQADGIGNSDYIGELIENVYIQKNKLIYVKRWTASYYSSYRLAGKRMGIYSAKINASEKQKIKDFDTGNNGYITAVISEPGEIYFSITNATTSFYIYKEDNITESKDLSNDSFYKFYPTYILSPNGQSTFWHEPRDGKNSLFVGSQSGGDGKQIVALSEYAPYGWYSDDYLLVAKNNSELYIMPATLNNEKFTLIKISDYHKPAVSFQGYGGGYGGL